MISAFRFFWVYHRDALSARLDELLRIRGDPMMVLDD